VKASALDARRLGFPVTLVSDACRGVDFPRGSIEESLAEMRKAAVDKLTAGQPFNEREAALAEIDLPPIMVPLVK
jgi:nicotinamidase-related amidase